MVIAGCFIVIMGIVAIVRRNTMAPALQIRWRRIGFGWFSRASIGQLTQYLWIGGLLLIVLGLTVMVVDIAAGGKA